MCGRLNLTDHPGVIALCEQLGIPLWPQEVPFARYKPVASLLTIIFEQNGERMAKPATWWLLLEETLEGYKPNYRFKSFNTRYDGLDNPRKAGFKPFRQGRCIIPVRGFGESEYLNQGGKSSLQHCHDMQATGEGALALGGLYKSYLHPETGVLHYACSVVTLAPHKKLRFIHSKSSPLILNQHNDETTLWLDCKRDLQQVRALLQPHLPQDLWAQKINKPSQYQAIDEPFLLEADSQ